MSQTERVEKRGDRVSTREMKPTEVQFDLVSSTQGCTECVSLCVYLRLFRPLLLCVLVCVYVGDWMSGWEKQDTMSVYTTEWETIAPQDIQFFLSWLIWTLYSASALAYVSLFWSNHNFRKWQKKGGKYYHTFNNPYISLNFYFN